MTSVNKTKTILRSLCWLQGRIEADTRRLKRMREQAAGGGGLDYSKQTIHGGTPQTMGDRVIAIVGLEKKLEASIVKRNEAAQKVLRIIDGVNDERLQLLLVLKYRDCYEWEDIAKEMHYTEDGIYKLHRQALKAAAAVNQQD